VIRSVQKLQKGDGIGVQLSDGSVVVFALVYYYYSTRKGNPNQHVDAMAMAKQVAIAAILAGLVIFGFFLWDVLKG
jgi:hypothetical protein